MDRPRSWGRSELGHALARNPFRGPGQITSGAQLGRLRLSEGCPRVLEGPVGDLATEHTRHVERLSEEHFVEREPVSVEPMTVHEVDGCRIVTRRPPERHPPNGWCR